MSEKHSDRYLRRHPSRAQPVVGMQTTACYAMSRQTALDLILRQAQSLPGAQP
ncbi:hypothetical protein RP726_04195 [Candidatus Methylospira mobilis]|uniref:hypothetical protein n=1 Tax=Candidatus Methylospira mobilis TaxID=1808979 RepID=UPI001884A499|nr:hypothetical protein [Candidatus Methylospira mobilis]WNV05626.1 hypothetical protein RP726_04195 [Candidatus Methylospira mobilis]